ncbi:MAG: zf-TFIIB domain-containing protein [Candidatus Woesearchaeota archaeon]
MIFDIFKKKIKVHGEHLFKCPRDGAYMEKLKKGDIILDICPRCKGMWLDNGEIEKISIIINKSKGEKHGKTIKHN